MIEEISHLGKSEEAARPHVRLKERETESVEEKGMTMGRKGEGREESLFLLGPGI